MADCRTLIELAKFFNYTCAYLARIFAGLRKDSVVMHHYKIVDTEVESWVSKLEKEQDITDTRKQLTAFLRFRFRPRLIELCTIIAVGDVVS